MNPEAKCVGGYFHFSHGSGDFEGMQAFGEAWVEWTVVEDVVQPTYQYHIGTIWDAPK